MSATSTRKGKVGEREVVAVLDDAGLSAYRTAPLQAARIRPPGIPDVAIYGRPDIHVEVKRQEVIELPAWTRQVERDCPAGSVPVIAFRRNAEPWRAVVPLDWLAALIRESNRRGNE